MIIIVIGMHRSGTSALAGLLHTNGICMGEENDFYPPPMRENPRGFYENKRFRNINDALLKEVGYRVKSFNPSLPKPRITTVQMPRFVQMVDLIEYYDKKYTVWGWKDPRTCLTLRHWLTAIKASCVSVSDIKIIVMLRKYADIAQSMLNRGNKEKLYIGQFADLARMYHTEAISALIDENIPYTNTSFEYLLFETNRAVDHINTYLNKTKIITTDFIDSKISRTNRPRHEI